MRQSTCFLVVMSMVLIVNFVSAKNLGPIPNGPGCENVVCKHNAVCISHHPHFHCDCDAICEVPEESSEICGSDNKTYSHICLMHRLNCKAGKDVVEKYHNGPCGMNLYD